MDKEFFKNQIKEFYDSFKSIESVHPKYYAKLLEDYKQIFDGIMDDEENSMTDSLQGIFSFRRLLLSGSKEKRNYFTISAKSGFEKLPSHKVNNGWGRALVYAPLNDHSRSYLKKGDVLFCYRQGQFDSLNDALNLRGIYAIGIAASDPQELFPKESGHNRWGVLIAFPIQLPNHLELRNIQMHPDTINLTPYNGNRNDALQYIPDETHRYTLMNMLYSRNLEIRECFENFFPEIEFKDIELPNKLLTNIYHKTESTEEFINLSKPNNFIQTKFIEWFNKPENFKKSYEGLITLSILNFWDTQYFNKSLFVIDTNDILLSITKIEKILSDKNNTEWVKCSEATSNGAPAAILGKNNYLKFLEEFLKIEENINYLNESLEKQIVSIKAFNYSEFNESAKKANLYLSKEFILRFVSSLLTKPFIILTGLSGSGKTKLALAFAMWICENKNQYCLVPVGADWTNREPLLGFTNALKSGEYIKPDNRVLDLIIAANENHNKPYFLILDEMNLSHVERYFADFLSVMESKGKTSLHTGDVNFGNVPAEIGFPDNLFIIGTVNIDETTYMFSPKVLDRASVIEFSVTRDEMESFMNNSNILKLESLKSAGASMAEDFVKIAKDNTIKTNDSENFRNELIIFFSELKKIGAEYGYRSASEIFRFAGVINRIEPTWSTAIIIDVAIMQKLLPKVHGSRRKLEPVLKTLGTLCLEEGNSFDEIVSKDSEIDFGKDQRIKYPISFEKILRMYKTLVNNGFTSYAEA